MISQIICQNVKIPLELITMFFTMFNADDIVLFSTSSEGLQQRINGLKIFCKEWYLDLNVSKKILIFN